MRVVGSVGRRNRVMVTFWLLSFPSTHVLISAVGLEEPRSLLLPTYSFKFPRIWYLCPADSSSLRFGFPRDRKPLCPISISSTCPQLPWNYSLVIFLDCSPISLVSGVNVKNAKPFCQGLDQNNIPVQALFFLGTESEWILVQGSHWSPPSPLPQQGHSCAHTMTSRGKGSKRWWWLNTLWVLQTWLYHQICLEGLQKL